MDKEILLAHGSGGKLSAKLIREVFMKHFHNEYLEKQSDAAIFITESKKMAFTTDSYVVDPVFFPGGNIGKLAVAGTVNDLAVCGAIPKYLTAGFIIEEGFPVKELEIIVASMTMEAKNAGVLIVSGDTKVVNKGKCDKIFINTAGVGSLKSDYEGIAEGKRIEAGDKILINGSIADHGMAIMTKREALSIHLPVESDCACLNGLIHTCLDNKNSVHFMRDATRGGLATVLCELAEMKQLGVSLFEDKIPVKEEVRGLCELLGFDPLYVANEGKVVMVVKEDVAEEMLYLMQQHLQGKQAAIIGEITSAHPGQVNLKTIIGGARIVDMLSGDQLPRIC